MKIFTWKRRGIIFGTTLGSILVFCLLGYGFDRMFGTGPAGIIVGLFVSFPLAQILMIRWLKRDMHKAPPSL